MMLLAMSLVATLLGPDSNPAASLSPQAGYSYPSAVSAESGFCEGCAIEYSGQTGLPLFAVCVTWVHELGTYCLAVGFSCLTGGQSGCGYGMDFTSDGRVLAIGRSCESADLAEVGRGPSGYAVGTDVAVWRSRSVDRDQIAHGAEFGPFPRSGGALKYPRWRGLE